MKPGAGIALVLLLGARPALGQVQARLDAGLGNLGPVSLAPLLRIQRGQTRVELTGEYRDFKGTGQAAAGRLTAGWFHALAGRFRAELTGTIEGQGGAGLTSAGAAWGGLRLHLLQSDQGLWLGYQGGREYLGQVRRWEAAAWKRLGQLSIQLQGWQTATTLSQRSGVDTASGFPDTLSPPTVRSSTQNRTTTDFGLWLGWTGSRADLTFSSGLRFGLRELTPGLGAPQDGSGSDRRTGLNSTWWMAEGTWWLTNRIGMVGTVGRQPVDPAVASTGESFMRLGFRAALQTRRAAAAAVRPGTAAGLRVRRVRGELVEFVLVAPPQTQRVELMGDFTDWHPVSLEQTGALWVIQLAAASGVHRMNVRYDGGPWRAPPAARVVWDEFGTESGELLIR